MPRYTSAVDPLPTISLNSRSPSSISGAVPAASASSSTGNGGGGGGLICFNGPTLGRLGFPAGGHGMAIARG
eukprot:CAMPEP_0172881808 /NCGR_PEP_ID=MMETSP1075-20121228/118478_1 /TAXON_ID=2916 /ORGANISM="Ceratium fusus, Strain PA161109" /LENGTH=71 /DNA_ID=CAMNT_0013734351 /DNA_START=86 /DNA_END=297 /DNA_ORIENTATION=-